MILLLSLCLMIWIVVSLVPLDQRARVAVGVALVIVLLLGLLGVFHIGARP